MKEQYEALKMEVIRFDAEIGTVDTATGNSYVVGNTSEPFDPTQGNNSYVP